MSDTLGDLGLLPANFVDGQAPTARYFNAAFGQIETAFDLLSQVIGDFDGTGEGEDTYVPNLIRAFGNMGWINCRLPSNLKVPVGEGGGVGGDLPFIIEELDENFLGKKEATLTFLPAVSGANDPDVTDVNMGTGVATGTPITQNLGVSGRFVLDGKRVLTSTAIPAGASLAYPIDTGSDLFRDSYGPENGCNVIPSMPQIYSNEASLCTITQPGGYQPNEYRIDFPTVTRIMNPQVPFSTEEGLDVETDTIQLDGNGPSPVRWSGTVPKYPIPAKIINLVSETLIPYNMVSLWFHNGLAPVRVRPTLSNDQFRWDQIPETLTSIKLTVPAGFTLPEEPGDEGANRYIVCFAGTSVADALVHERAHALRHSHDGNEGTPIEARDLTERFNPANWFHSTKAYHHFPQYFERGGTNSDTLNRLNAILGNVHIANTGATESNTTTPNNAAVDSYKLSFSDPSDGPQLWYDVSDLAGAGVHQKKLYLDDASLRVSQGGLWIGPYTESIGLRIENQAIGSILNTDRYVNDNASAAYGLIAADALVAKQGVLFFDYEDPLVAGVNPIISFVANPGDFDTWSFLSVDGSITNTEIRVGQIETNGIVGPAGGVQDVTSLVFADKAHSFYGTTGFRSNDGDMAFEHPGVATLVWDTLTGGTLGPGGADGNLLFRPGFGDALFVPDGHPLVPFWEIRTGGGAEHEKVLLLQLDIPGILSRSRLTAVGLDFTLALTGINTLLRAIDATPSEVGDSIWIKLYRIKTLTAGAWSANGAIIGGGAEMIYRTEGTHAEILGAGGFPDYISVPVDGGGVGSHTIDSDYSYFLLFAARYDVDVDFIGYEITFETNLVA